MFKKLLSLFTLALIILASCNQGTKTPATAVVEDTAKLLVASFDTSAYRFVDKPVIIEGTVFHTCKHSGKRLFLVDGTDSIRVKVTTGPDIVKFDEALTGSRIRILGILKEERIDEKYLSEWENEIKKPKENHETGVHTGAMGHEDQSIQDKLNQINELRSDIKKSGKDHLSFYSVEAIRLEEIK
jgi:hypothetical protein